jgi:beta-glucosidase
VTLFHWDMPQSLMDIGGFLNSDIKYYFANYSQFVFEHFGDRVRRFKLMFFFKFLFIGQKMDYFK